MPDAFLQDVGAFWDAVETALDAVSEDARIDFEVTTRTWRHKPDFVMENPGLGERKVYTTDDIYRFVAHGTKVRYATMGKGFRAKTIPEHIYSGPGRGGVAYISRKHPRPGIKARKFDEVIAKKWRDHLPQIMQRAVNATIKKMGG